MESDFAPRSDSRPGAANFLDLVGNTNLGRTSDPADGPGNKMGSCVRVPYARIGVG